MTRRFQSTRKFDEQFKQLDAKTSKQAEEAIELSSQTQAIPRCDIKSPRNR